MIYNTAVEQIKGAKTAQSEMLLPILRLATVTSLSNGRAYVQFYGEATASSKLYPYLSGYKPEVGDKVLIFQQGSTYIIAGKISKDNVGDTYYITKALLDTALNGYLTRAVADTLYEPKGGGSADKIQNNSYYFGFSGSSSTTLIGNKLSGSGTTALDLGSTSYPFNAGYFSTLGGDSSNGSIQTLNVKSVKLYGDIVPDTTNARTLGSSSYKFKNIYTEALNIGTIEATKWKPNANYSAAIDASAGSSGASFTPNGTVNLGSTSSKLNSGHFTTLGGNSSSNAVQTAYIKDLVPYGSILPASNNYSLGDLNHKFGYLYLANNANIGGTVYSSGLINDQSDNTRDIGASNRRWKNIYGTNIFTSSIHLGTASSYTLDLGYSNGSNWYARPSSSGVMNLGSSSYQFKNCYANQFYQNGTAISTSDRRKKTGIKDFTKKYIEFFKKLKPKLFRFKDGESGRLHSGFIAQDVEEAAAESGIPTKDLAFLCIDEDGNYGLRYEELIALQTKVIQDLMARVEALEEKVKGR